MLFIFLANFFFVVMCGNVGELLIFGPPDFSASQGCVNCSFLSFPERNFPWLIR
jgi:hypothetical protein